MNEKIDQDFYRKWMEHEDSLIDKRMGWLLTSQSILFAAYAIVLAQKESEMPPSLNVLKIIPLIALVSGVSIFVSIVAALTVWRWIRRKFPKDDTLTGPHVTHFLGLQSYVILPSIFISAWLYFITGNILSSLVVALGLPTGALAWYYILSPIGRRKNVPPEKASLE